MKRDKADLYAELSKDKSSAEFLEYFFSYNPTDTAANKKKLISALRKTKKNRKTIQEDSSRSDS